MKIPKDTKPGYYWVKHHDQWRIAELHINSLWGLRSWKVSLLGGEFTVYTSDIDDFDAGRIAPPGEINPNEPDQIFRLAKSIDGQEVTTDELTPEQAETFIHTAQHMIGHIRREFNLSANPNEPIDTTFEELCNARIGASSMPTSLSESALEQAAAYWEEQDLAPGHNPRASFEERVKLWRARCKQLPYYIQRAIDAETKDLTRKGEGLCEQNGTLLVQQHDLKNRLAIAKDALKMIGADIAINALKEIDQ